MVMKLIAGCCGLLVIRIFQGEKIISTETAISLSFILGYVVSGV